MKDYTPFGGHHQSIPLHDTSSMYNSKAMETRSINQRNSVVSQTQQDFYRMQPDKARHQHSQSLLNDYSANDIMHKTMYGSTALGSQPQIKNQSKLASTDIKNYKSRQIGKDVFARTVQNNTLFKEGQRSNANSKSPREVSPRGQSLTPTATLLGGVQASNTKRGSQSIQSSYKVSVNEYI